MALNQSIVNRQYSPTGVNFPDGLRVGAFNMGGSNTVGLGVPVGNTQVYSIKPVDATADGSQLTTEQVVLNNSYMPLNVQPFLVAGAATIVDNSLKLDVPRVVGVAAIDSPDASFSCRMSVIDRYGQEQVFEGAATEDEPGQFFFTPLQGTDRITSVFLYNMSDPTTTKFALYIYNTFDLPYSDIPFGETVGDPSRIISLNMDGKPLIQITTESVAPYPAAWQGVITPGNFKEEDPQGVNDNTRPQYTYIGENALGNKVLTVQQAVDQYGWTFNGQPFNSNVNNYENRLRALIGPQPYSVGWTDWQG